MPIQSESVEKNPDRRKQCNVRIIIAIFGLTVAGGLVIYWQYPNFYHHLVAQLYSWAARISALLGNEKIAYFAADRAATLDSTNVEYLNKRCWYGSLAGDAENVIDDCRRVVDEEPYSISAHCGLGVAFVFIGRYDNAITEFQFYIDNASQGHHDESFTQEHARWITLMRKGEKPFSDQTMRRLLLH